MQPEVRNGGSAEASAILPRHKSLDPILDREEKEIKTNGDYSYFTARTTEAQKV